MTEQVEVAVVGAGPSGICMATALRQRGFDRFVVLERASDVGGTWRDNTFPGLSCDIPARLYSLSFAPNAEWRRTFAPQREIHEYLRRCATRERLWPHIRLQREVTAADWDPDRRAWCIETGRERLTARCLVLAAGLHSTPAIPPVPGLGSFAGTVFHSAHWSHDHSLRGRRVAVVGTGASAAQFIPQIQPEVEHMVVFQRSPGWVMPRWERPVPALERAAMRYVPGLERLARAAIYWGREASLPGLIADPRLLFGVEALARLHLRSRVRDRELRRVLTPASRLGCKRVIVSNDYLPALTQPNVELVPHALREVTRDSAVGRDGVPRPVDTIIFATGFDVAGAPYAAFVRGRDGNCLGEDWARTGLRAYLGTTVHGFPNLFVMHGPNTVVGNGSQLFMIEAQARYTVRALEAMRARRAAAIEPRADRQADYNEWLDRKLERSVWTTGCTSWYVDHTGRPGIVWPDYSWRYRRRTARFDLADYELAPPRAAT